MGKIKLLFLFTFLVSMAGAKDTLHLIPYPEKMLFQDGVFAFSDHTQIILPKEYVTDLKPYLIEKMQADLGVSIQILTEENRKKSPSISFIKKVDHSKSLESYELKVAPTGITISAGSYAGLFYGFQTLR